MTIDEFFDRLAQDNAKSPNLHTLRSGVTADEREQWQRKNPAVRLPDDLWTLLARSNGIAMYQEWIHGQPIYSERYGALGIYPLEDFKLAQLDMYGQMQDDPRTRRWFSFGGGLDANLFTVFDLDTGHFLYSGPLAPDEAVEVGPRINRILDVLIAAEAS